MERDTDVKWEKIQLWCAILCTAIGLSVTVGSRAEAAVGCQDPPEKREQPPPWRVSLLGVYYLLPEDADIPVFTAQGLRDRIGAESVIPQQLQRPRLQRRREGEAEGEQQNDKQRRPFPQG